MDRVARDSILVIAFPAILLKPLKNLLEIVQSHVEGVFMSATVVTSFGVNSVKQGTDGIQEKWAETALLG